MSRRHRPPSRLKSWCKDRLSRCTRCWTRITGRYEKYRPAITVTAWTLRIAYVAVRIAEHHHLLS